MLIAADGSGGGILTFLPIILLVAALYFLMIRPQSKRRRDAMLMQATLGPGDEVQTIGGLYATVAAVDDESVTLEAAPGIRLRFARGAVARVMTSATQPEPTDEGDDGRGRSDGGTSTNPIDPD